MAAQSRVLALDDRLASTPQGGARLKVEVPMERPPELDRPESAVSERRASVDRDGVRAIRVFLIGEVRVYCDGLAQLLWRSEREGSLTACGLSSALSGP